MGHLTAEESLQKDISVLGKRYGTAFHHCCQELWRVSSNWDRYETLFGSKERVDILNSSSGNFWHVIQGMLHEHVLLGICRLTDPAVSRGRSNLSVAHLLAVDPTDTKDELANRVDVAIRNAQFARTWRHKRIAHNDLAQATGNANLLESSTGEKISSTIVAIHDVLRWIQGRYFDGDMYLLDMGDNDANELMVALARAQAMRDQEKADFEEKRYERLLNRPYKYPSGDYGRDKRYAAQSRLPKPESYRGKLPLET